MTHSQAPPPVPDFPLLEISAFVDRTTVVLVGAHVDNLEENEELYILAIGDVNIPKTNVPLVVPKASLEVTANAGLYALASSPAERTYLPGLAEVLAASASIGGRSQIQRRSLTRDDVQFLGNPARSPITVGDPVVRKSDLSKYLKWRSDKET